MPNFGFAAIPCVYRKLDSAILVMKAAENGVRRDRAEALNRAVDRRVLVQGTMSPRLIIVGGIRAKYSAQVRFTEYDHVVQALRADRANVSTYAVMLNENQIRRPYRMMTRQ